MVHFGGLGFDGFIMAKIFYCGGLAGAVGTLRAVIPVSELSSVLSDENPKYVGKSFPKIERAHPSCTVIEIVSDETQKPWKSGFYRTTKGPLQFEDYLRRSDQP